MNTMNDIKKDNTEEKILHAAQTVFIQKGMDGARMQEIANEAGINKALLHYYFRTKQKLFEAIFKKVFKQIFPKIETFILSDLPFEEKLGVFIDNYIDLLIKNPYFPAFILKEMEAGRIRKMDPRDLMINLLGLSTFPFAAKPLMKIMFFENDNKAYNQ